MTTDFLIGPFAGGHSSIVENTTVSIYNTVVAVTIGKQISTIKIAAITESNIPRRSSIVDLIGC